MVKQNTIKILIVLALIVGGFGLTASHAHADSYYGNDDYNPNFLYGNDGYNPNLTSDYNNYSDGYSYGYTTNYVNPLSYVPYNNPLTYQPAVNPLSSSYVPTVKTKKKKAHAAAYPSTISGQPFTYDPVQYPTYPTGTTTVTNQNPIVTNPVQTNPITTPVNNNPVTTNPSSGGGPVVGGHA